MSGAHDLTSMTISLPATQKTYVRGRAIASGCSTPSEYIRRLIHADEQAQRERQLELKILEGLESPTRVMSAADWKELRASLRRTLTKRRRAP